MFFGVIFDALNRIYPTRQVLSKVISEGLKWRYSRHQFGHLPIIIDEVKSPARVNPVFMI